MVGGGGREGGGEEGRKGEGGRQRGRREGVARISINSVFRYFVLRRIPLLLHTVHSSIWRPCCFSGAWWGGGAWHFQVASLHHLQISNQSWTLPDSHNVSLSSCPNERSGRRMPLKEQAPRIHLYSVYI